MMDRVSANPGRMLITPEDGSAPFYATLSMADNPTVEGTPLNKASLLTDATAALFGLGADAVPDDVLAKTRTLITTAQNTASAAQNKFAWRKIGTANLVGLQAKYEDYAQVSISLSERLSAVSEIAVTVENFDGKGLGFQLFDMTFGNPTQYGILYSPGISLPGGNTFSFQFDDIDRKGNIPGISNSRPSGKTLTAYITSNSGNYETVSTGTVNVYARGWDS